MLIHEPYTAGYSKKFDKLFSIRYFEASGVSIQVHDMTEDVYGMPEHRFCKRSIDHSLCAC